MKFIAKTHSSRFPNAMKLGETVQRWTLTPWLPGRRWSAPLSTGATDT